MPELTIPKMTKAIMTSIRVKARNWGPVRRARFSPAWINIFSVYFNKFNALNRMEMSIVYAMKKPQTPLFPANLVVLLQKNLIPGPAIANDTPELRSERREIRLNEEIGVETPDALGDRIIGTRPDIRRILARKHNHDGPVVSELNGTGPIFKQT